MSVSSKLSSSQLTVAQNQSALQASDKVGVSAEALAQEDQLSNTLLETHGGILRRIMPSATDREIEKFRANLVQAQATSRLDFFRQYKEFQRQSLKDAFDSLLIKGKIGLRGENTEFFAVHYRELANRVTQMVEDFLDDFEQRLDKAESTRSEFIKNKKLAMLEKRIEEFTQTVDLLMGRFADIPMEGV